jgi:hypothetical protein
MIMSTGGAILEGTSGVRFILFEIMPIIAVRRTSGLRFAFDAHLTFETTDLDSGSCLESGVILSHPNLHNIFDEQSW